MPADDAKMQGNQNGALTVFTKMSLLKIRRQYFKPSSPTKNKVKMRRQRSRHRSLDYFPGGRSRSSEMPNRVRDSISDIAHHMDIMDSLANQLQSSITMDMVKYSHVTSSGQGPQLPLPYGGECYHANCQCRPSGYVCYANSRVPYITGSIVDSYNMERDSDTVSYVSNHLANARHSKDVTQNYGDVTETSGHVVTSQQDDEQQNGGSCTDVLSSRDNLLPRDQVYTLESDMYYPSSGTYPPSRTHRPTHTGRKRTKKRGQSGNAKRRKNQHRSHSGPESCPSMYSSSNVSFVWLFSKMSVGFNWEDFCLPAGQGIMQDRGR